MKIDTITRAFSVLHNFAKEDDAVVIEAMDFLCQQQRDGKLNKNQRQDLGKAFADIKWGYPGISITAAEAPKYLTTHPGFLADIVLYKGWQFTLDERAKVK